MKKTNPVIVSSRTARKTQWSQFFISVVLLAIAWQTKNEHPLATGIVAVAYLAAFFIPWKRFSSKKTAGEEEASLDTLLHTLVSEEDVHIRQLQADIVAVFRNAYFLWTTQTSIETIDQLAENTVAIYKNALKLEREFLPTVELRNVAIFLQEKHPTAITFGNMWLFRSALIDRMTSFPVQALPEVNKAIEELYKGMSNISSVLPGLVVMIEDVGYKSN